MKVPVETPFFPGDLEVKAEFELGDPSRRIPSGIRLVVVWIDQNLDERGVEYFVPSEDLAG